RHLVLPARRPYRARQVAGREREAPGTSGRAAAAAGPGPGGSRPWSAVMGRCPAGHELTGHGLQRPGAACRREALIQYVTAAASVPASQAAAAIDVVAASPAVLRVLTAALAIDPDMLRHGAPPAAGRLAAELIARGSKTLTMPVCAHCGRAGIPLYRTPGGGMCKPCTARQITAACAHCGGVKPVV